jgi:hypothetical protein
VSFFCKYVTTLKPNGTFSGRLPNGGLFEIAKVYPLDAVFDTPEDVPEDVSGEMRVVIHARFFLVLIANCIQLV